MLQIINLLIEENPKPIFSEDQTYRINNITEILKRIKQFNLEARYNKDKYFLKSLKENIKQLHQLIQNKHLLYIY
jgi:hypothetical protein